MKNPLTLKQVAWRLGVTPPIVKKIIAANPAKYGAKVVDKRNTPGVLGPNKGWMIPLASVSKIRDDLPEGAKAKPVHS